MYPMFTTEIGRMRAEEMQARAAHYRLTHLAKRRGPHRQTEPLSRVQAFAYRRALRAATLALFVMATSLSVPVAHAQPACGGTDEATRTFDVKVRVADDVYERGATATFLVRVHRVVEGNDLGPAEGAHVGVGVSLSDVHLHGTGMTGDDGRSIVSVRLKRYAPAGLADVRVHASKLIADAPCHPGQEYEYGDVEKLGLFRVAR